MNVTDTTSTQHLLNGFSLIMQSRHQPLSQSRSVLLPTRSHNKGLLPLQLCIAWRATVRDSIFIYSLHSISEALWSANYCWLLVSLAMQCNAHL